MCAIIIKFKIKTKLCTYIVYTKYKYIVISNKEPKKETNDCVCVHAAHLYRTLTFA